ncbi:hypothetical protein [Siccirubricoccus phaeus]|nr:hypothetical protein [Siccirubricoccus phaeus]
MATGADGLWLALASTWLQSAPAMGEDRTAPGAAAAASRPEPGMPPGG